MCLGYPGSREASSNTQCLSPGIREKERGWVHLDSEVFESEVESAQARRSFQLPKTRKCLVTFEEDEFAILPLIGSVDGGREAPPELANGHWVPIHHLVIPHPPEPSLLETSKDEENTLCLISSSSPLPTASPLL